jgi:CubicO group peptidase (beta-lactamase class C family)
MFPILRLFPSFIRVLTLWLICFFATDPAIGEDGPPPSPKFGDFQEHAAFERFRGLARVTRGDKVLFEVSKGWDYEGQPIDAATLFWVGSVSKQFVGVAAVRLETLGKLNLADPVAKHIPDWPADALQKDGVDCTIALLLSHQCGIPPARTARIFDGHSIDPSIETAFLAWLDGIDLEFKPGTDSSYSNEGFDLGGILIEKVSGQSLDSFLHQTFYESFGMETTGSRVDRLARFPARLAVGHMPIPFGALRVDTWAWFGLGSPQGGGASGNVASTAAELERWNRALFRDQGLSPSEVKALTQPRYRDDGLGIVKKKRSFGHEIWHNGILSPEGYSSYVAYVPETDTTVVVLQNQDIRRFSDDVGRALVQLSHGMDLGEIEIESRAGVLTFVMSSVLLVCRSPLLFLLLFIPWIRLKPVEKSNHDQVVLIQTFGWPILALQFGMAPLSYWGMSLSLAILFSAMAIFYFRRWDAPVSSDVKTLATRMGINACAFLFVVWRSFDPVFIVYGVGILLIETMIVVRRRDQT